MGPESVVMVTPVGDEHLRLERGCEAFAVQEFVSEFADPLRQGTFDTCALTVEGRPSLRAAEVSCLTQGFLLGLRLQNQLSRSFR